MLVFLHLLLSDFGGILELVFGISSGFLEESIINVGLDSVKGNFGGSGNHVSRVDSSKGDTIDGIGSGDQKVA